MKRDKTLDIAKGIAIILMMYGHLKYTYANMDKVYCWIYSFHMPLFMYITGCLTSVKTDGKMSQVITKAKKILVPYALWNATAYLVSYIVGFDSRTFGQFLHGLVFGDGLNSNLPTWYLLSLFWISLFAIYVLPLLDTVKKLIVVDCVAILLMWQLPLVKDSPDYFRLKGVVALLPFFITGYLFKKLKFKLPWWLVAPAFALGFQLSRVNAIQSWRYITVGNGDICVPHLYLLSAMCTILALLETCRYIAKVPGSAVVGMFGKHSLIILVTHWVIGKFLEVRIPVGMKMFWVAFVIECVIIGCIEWYHFIQAKRNTIKYSCK